MISNRVNKRFLSGLFAAVYFICPIHSQSESEINSLIDILLSKNFKSLVSHPNDSLLINESLKNAEAYSIKRNDSALFYANQAIIQAENAGLIQKISIALQLKGKFYLNSENFEQASSSFIYALKIEEKLNNKNRIADLNDELATIYYYQEIFEKSLYYNQNALSIFRELNDTLGQAKVLSHLGSLFSSREYCEKRTPDQIIKDQEKALEYYEQSLALYNEIGFQPGIIHTGSNMGNLFRRMGQAEKALPYIEKALDYFRKTNDVEKVVETLNTLALAYNRLSEFESALNCLIEAEEIAKKEKLSNGIQFLYETIAQTYENIGDYKNSRDYYVKYMILRDSIYNNKKSQQIFELETKYQSEKKQSEIEKLNLIKKQRTLIIYILIGSLSMILLFSYTIFRNIQNKNIITCQQLELKEKQLIELERERQLIAARSVL
ncbi:MAG: tetratricopeptide repeat protein, partial [Bacteroidales bacterium]|nr:tetratricopeptide repeat protein [Bacteroidales bacterium]